MPQPTFWMVGAAALVAAGAGVGITYYVMSDRVEAAAASLGRKPIGTNAKIVGDTRLEAYARATCPDNAVKTLVVESLPNTNLGDKCRLHNTLAAGDTEAMLRCLDTDKEHTYGEALCVTEEALVTYPLLTVVEATTPTKP